MAIRYITEYYNDSEDQRHREIYAGLYAIMKTRRWNTYRYDDVEDMAAEKAIACQEFLNKNSETLRLRQN